VQQPLDDPDMYGPIIKMAAADDQLQLLSSPDRRHGVAYDDEDDQQQLLSSPDHRHGAGAYDDDDRDRQQQQQRQHRMIMMHNAHVIDADPDINAHRSSSCSGRQYGSCSNISSTDVPAKRDQYSYDLIDHGANFGGGSAAAAADDRQWQYVKQHEQLQFTDNINNIIAPDHHELYPDHHHHHHHHPPHTINAALITSTSATAAVNAAAAAVNHAAYPADPSLNHGTDNYAPLSAPFMLTANVPDHHHHHHRLINLRNPALADHHPAGRSIDHHLLHPLQLNPSAQYPQLLAPAAHNLPHLAADDISVINPGSYIGFDPAILSANHFDHHHQQQQQQQLMMINGAAARTVNSINHDQPRGHINHRHHHHNHENIGASSSMSSNSSQYAKKNSAQFGLYKKAAHDGPANQRAPPGSLQLAATAKPARSTLRSVDDQVSTDPETSNFMFLFLF
jgi:hypothetical protein